MTFAEPQNTRPGSDSPQPLETATKPVAPRNGIDGRLRLYLGAVAVLALVLLVALESRSISQARGLEVMIGCMVSTSLAVAPALLLAPQAEVVDLDGPLLLAKDREGATHEKETSLLRHSAAIWGSA